MATCSSRWVVTGADADTSTAVVPLAAVRLEEFDYELPADRIAQVPIEPRDAARLLVDRGTAPPDHRTVAELPSCCGPATCRRQQHGVIPARLGLRRATGGAAEVLLLEPLSADRAAWEALVRPARRLRAGEVLHAPDGRAVLTIGGRTESGETFRVELHEDRLAELDELGEMPLPPYIPRGSTGPSATRRCTPPSRVRPPRRRPACTSHRSCSTGSGRPVSTSRRVELVVGLDTFRPITVDDPRDHRCTASATACRRRRGRRAGRPAAWSPSARPPFAPWRAPAATGRLDGRTELFIHRGATFQVVDVLLTNFHLPRTTLLMMIDAFVGPRWRDCTRRRWPRATASCRSATPCSSIATRDGSLMLTPVASLLAARSSSRRGEPTARPAPASPRGARVVPHAVLHAGRHPGGGQVPQRRRLRSARRRDRARQHLPPHAAPRRRVVARFGGLGALRRLERPDADRLRRLPGVLARSRRSTTTASRSAAPTTARRTASPRSRPWSPRSCSAPTSRWCSTCARRCRARRGVVELAVERTAAWAKRARSRARPRRAVAVRHRPGWHRRGRCGPTAPSEPSSSTSTATGSAGCRWGRPAPRCCRPSPPPSSSCPSTGRATSWASATRRRSSRRWHWASTSSTA